VRVLTKDGNWVGGYAGTESFYTNYPQSREVFVETAWKLSEQGEFEHPITGSTGQWIKCDDAPVVEFLGPQGSAPADTGSSEPEGGKGNDEAGQDRV
jgi:hypothetical protein